MTKNKKVDVLNKIMECPNCMSETDLASLRLVVCTKCEWTSDHELFDSVEDFLIKKFGLVRLKKNCLRCQGKGERWEHTYHNDSDLVKCDHCFGSGKVKGKLAIKWGSQCE